MNPMKQPLLFTTALLLSAGLSCAATLPRLGQIQPHGGQRGTELVVDFQGNELTDPQEVFFYEPGLSVTKLELAKNGDKPNPNLVKVTLKIAPDCPLGEHRMRLRTLHGWTDLKTFYVGAYPSVDEKEPNGDFAAPQKIEMNVTVHGKVDNEDVDYYVVDARKGQRISAEVEGIRLGIDLFDPYVAILDKNRFELAAADDTALLNQDCFASVIAPADGPYIVMVRESAYGGGGNDLYRLHVGEFPRPLVAYPLGGKIGELLHVKLLGDKAGPIESDIQLPAEAPAYSARNVYPIFTQQNGQITPSPNPIRVSNFGGVLEAEPNNDKEHATPIDAEPPLALNGVIGEKGDHDWFRFKAKKGTTLDVRVFARGLRTPLDSVIDICKADGGSLGGNDDAGESPDSYFRFGVPEDGFYFAHIRDHLGAGGEAYAYRIEVTPAAPAFRLDIPEVSRNESQLRQYIAVPKGNRFAVLIQANRADFGGPLKFMCDDLPPGVSLVGTVMAENVNQAMLVFEAAPDAAPVGKLCDLRAAHTDEKTGIAGRYQHDICLVRGEPNQTSYYHTPVDRLPVAVTSEAPFKVNIVEPKVPLVQAGQMQVKVVAERKEGFKGPINLQLPFRSPGVSGTDTITIPEGQTEAMYPINAAGNAALGNWPIAMTAVADVGGIEVYTATQLAHVTVAGPLLGGEIPMAAGEQGQTIDVVVKLSHPSPFDGEATLTLYGLPDKCTTDPVKITKDSAEAIFKVKTAPESPVGQHKSLFCQVSVPQNGETILQSVGGGVLRIDKPRPAPVAAPAPVPAAVGQPAPPPAAKPAEPKRLTRLEQLRLEAEERAKAGK
jgi:hypothetical protein